MREAGHRGDRTRPPGRAVHDRRVQLDLAHQVRQPADPDVVVGLVGLHDPDGRLDRVHRPARARTAPAAQHRHPGRQAHLSAALAGDQDRLGHRCSVAAGAAAAGRAGAGVNAKWHAAWCPGSPGACGQRGIFLLAARLGHRAAGAEPAPGGDGQRARRVAGHGGRPVSPACSVSRGIAASRPRV